MSQFDRYDIIEEVGRSNFVTLYKAHDRQMATICQEQPTVSAGEELNSGVCASEPAAQRETWSSPGQKCAATSESNQLIKKQSIISNGWLTDRVLGIVIIGFVLLILSGCNPDVVEDQAAEDRTVTSTPMLVTQAATEDAGAVDKGEEEEDSPSPGELGEVAREDTLIIGWGVAQPIGVTNPWAIPDYAHDNGNDMMWEGLAYFKIFADETQPWLAESMAYTNDDFRELTIKLRPEAKWSDGTPVTSADVAYTLEGHLNNELLPHHAAFDEFVAGIEAVDDLTTVVTFNQPAPRFAFEVLTLKFNTGIAIVPAHVLEPLEDPTAFAGSLETPHSGPYSTVAWDESQRILDLREDWWAVDAGLIDTPDVKRIIVDDIFNRFSGDMELVAQRVANNEMDMMADLRPDIIAGILEQNSAVTSHTGNKPPYGYLDWWPNSLWVNTLLPPYDDARVRRAISLAIDRDTIDEVVYEGAHVSTIFPFPLYPGLANFVARDDVQALIKQYEPRKFDLEKSASLMEEAGFVRNSGGLWERDGETVNATIHGFESIHSDIAPVLEQMLLDAGFEAAVNFGGNPFERMVNGSPGMYLFGHGASLVDPYAGLEAFHSRYSGPIGTVAIEYRFSRYSNSEFDAILDEMAPLGADDPRFLELAVEALEIYWRDQIDIPIIQWLHRIPYNQTYWSNWPTADNLGPGVNGAFWHHTGMLLATGLEKAQ